MRASNTHVSGEDCLHTATDVGGVVARDYISHVTPRLFYSSEQPYATRAEAVVAAAVAAGAEVVGPAYELCCAAEYACSTYSGMQYSCTYCMCYIRQYLSMWQARDGTDIAAVARGLQFYFIVCSFHCSPLKPRSPPAPPLLALIEGWRRLASTL